MPRRASGARYAFPEVVSGKLDAKGAKTSATGETLTIVSTATLSAEQMKQARPLAVAAK